MTARTRRAALLTTLLASLLVTLFVTGLATLLVTAGQASAHSSLIGSTPTEGQRLERAPALVSLTFDEEIRDDVNQVAVTGPDGGQWAEGPVQVAGSVVVSPLRPLGPAGEYTVGYRVVSADGDPVTGEITFTLLSAGAGAAPGSGAEITESAVVPAASRGGPSGLPLSGWVAGALAALAIGLTVAVRAGQRGGRPE